MTIQPTFSIERRTSIADAHGVASMLGVGGWALEVSPAETGKITAGRARHSVRAGLFQPYDGAHGVACPTSQSHFGTRSKSTNAAFTLIEVLLAVGIFAIVLFAMNTVFYSALKLERATTRSVDERAALNQAFAQLRRDLRGAVPPLTNSYLLPRDFRVTGSSGRMTTEQTGSLEFYTTTGRINDVDPWSELQRVRYELIASSDPASRGRELVRVVVRNILATTTEEEVEQLLLTDVESLEFQCFDGTGWNSAWDTTAADVGLPQAVRVRVLLAAYDPNASRLRREPLELMVPIVAQALTNQLTGGGQ